MMLIIANKASIIVYFALKYKLTKTPENEEMT